jgi:hypothetical protein
MVFLHNCTHNRFNEVWKGDISGADESGLRGENPARLLKPGEHRTLGCEYMGGFFRWRLKGENAQAGLFNGSIVNSLHAVASFQWSFGDPVIDVEDMENTTAGQTGHRDLALNASIKQFAQFSFRTPHQTHVLGVDPNLAAPTPAVLRLTFDQPRNWTGFSLLLRVGADFDITDETTIANGSLPEFEVVIGDGANTATVQHTAFQPNLTWPVLHNVATGPTTVVHATFIKLDSAAVAISAFQGIDPAKVRLVEIHPAANFPQRLFFDSLQVFK